MSINLSDIRPKGASGQPIAAVDTTARKTLTGLANGTLVQEAGRAGLYNFVFKTVPSFSGSKVICYLVYLLTGKMLIINLKNSGTPSSDTIVYPAGTSAATVAAAAVAKLQTMLSANTYGSADYYSVSGSEDTLSIQCKKPGGIGITWDNALVTNTGSIPGIAVGNLYRVADSTKLNLDAGWERLVNNLFLSEMPVVTISDLATATAQFTRPLDPDMQQFCPACYKLTSDVLYETITSSQNLSKLQMIDATGNQTNNLWYGQPVVTEGSGLKALAQASFLFNTDITFGAGGWPIQDFGPAKLMNLTINGAPYDNPVLPADMSHLVNVDFHGCSLTTAAIDDLIDKLILAGNNFGTLTLTDGGQNTMGRPTHTPAKFSLDFEDQTGLSPELYKVTFTDKTGLTKEYYEVKFTAPTEGVPLKPESYTVNFYDGVNLSPEYYSYVCEAGAVLASAVGHYGTVHLPDEVLDGEGVSNYNTGTYIEFTLGEQSARWNIPAGTGSGTNGSAMLDSGSWDGGNAPTWLAFNSSSGVFSFTVPTTTTESDSIGLGAVSYNSVPGGSASIEGGSYAESYSSYDGNTYTAVQIPDSAVAADMAHNLDVAYGGGVTVYSAGNTVYLYPNGTEASISGGTHSPEISVTNPVTGQKYTNSTNGTAASQRDDAVAYLGGSEFTGVTWSTEYDSTLWIYPNGVTVNFPKSGDWSYDAGNTLINPVSGQVYTDSSSAALSAQISDACTFLSGGGVPMDSSIPGGISYEFDYPADDTLKIGFSGDYVATFPDTDPWSHTAANIYTDPVTGIIYSDDATANSGGQRYDLEDYLVTTYGAVFSFDESEDGVLVIGSSDEKVALPSFQFTIPDNWEHTALSSFDNPVSGTNVTYVHDADATGANQAYDAGTWLYSLITTNSYPVNFSQVEANITLTLQELGTWDDATFAAWLGDPWVYSEGSYPGVKALQDLYWTVNL